MSRQRPSAWAAMWNAFFTSLNRRPNRRVVGADRFGNTYYEEDKSAAKATNRGFIPSGKHNSATLLDDINRERHPLWEEWLRQRRDVVPTQEEMAVHDANYEQRMALARANDMRVASEAPPLPLDDMDALDAASGRRTVELQPRIGVRRDPTANAPPRQANTAYREFDEYEVEPGTQKGSRGRVL